jgi:hypothetical protein
MSLSSDIISQFVKATKDDKKTIEETTLYGTTVEYDGKMYVKIDGSDRLTPVSTTADTKVNERVTVLIKNHAATVTGNITSPSTHPDQVKDLGTQISEFEIVIADKVDTQELVAVQGQIENLYTENAAVKQTLSAQQILVEEIKAENVEINGTLTAVNADVETLKATMLTAEIADVKYATIANLEATNADVHNLAATYADFKVATVERLDATDAKINNLDAEYANIDFSNISKATMEYFYAKSGLIENVQVGDATISGTLAGVTILGDYIKGGTVVADKLVIKGEDGLYYKLNLEAGVVESSEYQEVEYLEGMGTQYIDTGLDYFADFEVGIKLKNNVSNKALGNGRSFCLQRISADNPCWQFTTGSGKSFLTSVPITERHIMKWKDNKAYADGVLLAEHIKHDNAGNRMHLFAVTNDGTAYPGVIYFCKLWDSNGNLVRDLIPCYRKSDNKPGLYDLVTNAFFTNAGTGEFLVGSDISTENVEVTKEELQNGLHGSVIVAKTITAEKITVDDLVAFGATIGGFNITNKSIYSGVKESLDNTTDGIYLGSDGQVAIGGSNEYIKYRKDENGDRGLEIAAKTISFVTGDNTVKTVNDLQSAFDRQSKHFDFTDNGFIITDASSGGRLEMILDGGVLYFKKNGLKFGQWDGVNFYTGNIIVQVNERAQFGNFAYIPRNDKSLMFSLVNHSASDETAVLGEAILGKMILGKEG